MRTTKKINILVILLVFLFVVTACSSKDNKSDPVQTQSAQSSGKPAKAYVFTYNADCCESTKKIFEDHRNTVKDFENRYGKDVKFTWYDVSFQSDSYQKDLMEAAQKAGVNKIPAIVVLDSEGNVLNRQIGNIKTEELNKVFERLGR